VESGSGGSTVSGVSEDFVKLSIPGCSGTPSGPVTTKSSLLISPMFSIGSASSGVARGGSFGKEADGKEFSVVLVKENVGTCLSNIGEGGKFCLKTNCQVAAHRAATKFYPTSEGSIVIAKGRDVAFASPALGGQVLPQSVLEVWYQETRTLYKIGTIVSRRPCNTMKILFRLPTLKLRSCKSSCLILSRLQERRRASRRRSRLALSTRQLSMTKLWSPLRRNRSKGLTLEKWGKWC
jgi:hypothetical protein